MRQRSAGSWELRVFVGVDGGATMIDAIAPNESDGRPSGRRRSLSESLISSVGPHGDRRPLQVRVADPDVTPWTSRY
jgi:hypothetical protein